MIVNCRKCGEQREQAKGQGNLCLDCNRQYQRDYRAKNRIQLAAYWREKNLRDREKPEWVENERARGRRYWAEQRHEAIMAYGGYRCACCGETEPMFLSIDHIFNDGAEHRRSLGYDDGNGKGGSSATISWLKRNNYPAGFQVLCMNCNMGKHRNGGTCPHKASLLCKTA